MKYHQLQATANKTKKRVGRGIAAGQGKTAGRGTKGQGSRTGSKFGASFMGGQTPMVASVPKNRGFKSLRTPAQVVYLDRLNEFAGKTVDNMLLFKNGYIATPFHTVKVITRGDLTVKINLRVQAASKSAITSIEKAGGSFEKIAVPLKKSAKEAAQAEA